MKTGIIYKYTNQTNGKIYVGQTTTSLETRHKKHLSQLNDNTYFHKAIKKYGIENFSLEVLEKNIPLETLDEREIYWIKTLDCYYTSGKGYNLTKGGQWGTSSQLVCGSAEEEIKDLLANSSLTFQQIGDLYGISLWCISDINRGKTFFEQDRIYPIRETIKKTPLSSELVSQIIDLLISSNLSIEGIGEKLQISSYTIGEINRGKNSWCPKDRTYPIRKGVKENTYQNKLTQEDVIDICRCLVFSSDTLEIIGQNHGVAKNTVGDISRGITWKEITSQFKCPIRRNKLENQKIFTSIYGIV